MVIADFSGDFVNTENTKKGDIVVIVGASEYVEIEKDGKVRRILNIPVEVNQARKIYSPSREVGKAIVKAFGSDTDKWIGQKLQAEYVSYKSFGETKISVDCLPLVEKI